MKGLRKYLTPFAPDQSGATSVFYDMGGIIVICDAGGCTGNICGFDEPRWTSQKSAIFSAGLRDMDAIFGQDERLLKKLQYVSEQIKANFIALIGTPVPATIGTDLLGIERLAQKKSSIPVLSVSTTGMKNYDAGIQEAYLALFRKLAGKTANEDRVGVIGCVPLELGHLSWAGFIEKELKKTHKKVSIYGMGASFEEVCTAGNAQKNIVVSPSGIQSAKYLQKTFGTPYEVAFPGAERLVKAGPWQKPLIVHQQVLANSLRERIPTATVGSWFTMDKTYKKPEDVHFKEEDDFEQFVTSHDFDCIIADEAMRKIVRNYKGKWISLPHFAVSGKRDVL